MSDPAEIQLTFQFFFICCYCFGFVFVFSPFSFLPLPPTSRLLRLLCKFGLVIWVCTTNGCLLFVRIQLEIKENAASAMMHRNYATSLLKGVCEERFTVINLQTVLIIDYIKPTETLHRTGCPITASRDVNQNDV